MLRRMQDFLGRMHPVRAPEYKSVFRQYLEMLWLALRYRLSPIEYYLYRLGRKDASLASLSDYIISAEAAKRIRPRLNPRMWEVVLRNKVLFNSHMRAQGLPVAKLYGVFHPGFGYTAEGGNLRNIDELAALLQEFGRLVLKPLDGLKGQGVFILDAAEGDKLSTAQAAALNQGNGWIVEQHLRNEPVLARFNPDTLNTCRVVTFLDNQGDSSILFAVARFGRRKQQVDSMSTGAVSVHIDVETGALGQGVMYPQFGGWCERHPDSGLEFAGTVIPQWTELLDVVRRAARSLPWCPAIGWDVAVTTEGPVLVEGNGQWNVMTGQAFTGGLLTGTLRQELNHLGVGKGA
ncbi:MAG: hypothetical protein FH749_14705 [Firmicutes bacterium]|nr:hypothetical protein [Bacillota bacterium]